MVKAWRIIGTMMEKSRRIGEAPSICAASRSSWGTFSMAAT